MQATDRAAEDAGFPRRLENLEAAVSRAVELRAPPGELQRRAASAVRSFTQPAPVVPTDAAFAEFSTLLAAEGIRKALAYLLGLSPYRFIGIFRFEGGKAAAAVHYDRENPDVLTADEVPDTATYCCYVRDSGGAFTTAHAVMDPRLADHPAREAVQAYCGIPVMTAEGEILGTLCHYDLDPRDPQTLDLPLLLQVASALAQSGRVPPYPRP